MPSDPHVASDPRLVAFGRALVDARIERGYTLDDLSDHSGMSRRTISYLEGGLTNPRLLTIVALSHALDIDPARLVQPVMDVPAPATD